MNVLALDFDGVLCDSATETAVTAWRAGQQLWPAWKGSEPPATWLTRFRQLRPVIETGYQAIALLRLIADGVPDAEILAGFPHRAAAVSAQTGRSVAELVHLFGEARDLWIARDAGDWLGCHRFYPGVTAMLRRACAVAELFILTTKQRRFTELLLRAEAIDLAAERVFGLEAGRRKEDVLLALIGQTRLSGAHFWFVEDRLATLESAAARVELTDLRLCLATWGYCLEEEVRRARANPRLLCLGLEQFTAPGFP